MGHYKQDMDTKKEEIGTLDVTTGVRFYPLIRSLNSYDYFRRRLNESDTLISKDVVMRSGILEANKEEGRPIKAYMSLAFHNRKDGEKLDWMFGKFSEIKELENIISNLITLLCILKRRQIGNDPFVIDKDLPIKTLLADLFIKDKYIYGSKKLVEFQEEWREKRKKEMEVV